MFQSTHPRGVRPNADKDNIETFKFQSTHPRGVRRGQAFRSGLPHAVSIHAPAWGATVCNYVANVRIVCFNPRTRVGCDRVVLSFLPVEVVSIHAPAWGATRGWEKSKGCCLVSIHAPAWGATHYYLPLIRFSSCFNPRTRVGCDPQWVAISGLVFSFNPRTRVGCDSRFACFSNVSSGFNPRTRVGCDLWSPMNVGRYRTVSIHAPAWGATPYGAAVQYYNTAFQSTHPRGVRHSRAHHASTGSVFQSTHPRGVRRLDDKNLDLDL